jgi:hypothetical protein
VPEQEHFACLQDWMEHHGVHTTELARRAKMSKSHLSMCLKGSRRLSFYKALVLWELIERTVPLHQLVRWPKVPLQRTFLEVSSHSDIP